MESTELIHDTYTLNSSSTCSEQLNIINVTTCETHELFYQNLYSMTSQLIIAIAYSCVSVLALLGNALVCYAVFYSPKMQTGTNYLIVNLAISDLVVAVFCGPFSCVLLLLQHWPLGHFLCYFFMAQNTSVLASSYSLVAIAADRYIAILYPLRPRLQKSGARTIIIGIWLTAAITGSPGIIFTEYYQDFETGLYVCIESGWTTMGMEEYELPYNITFMVLQYFFPVTVLILTFSRIAKHVWSKKSLLEAEEDHQHRVAKTKPKMIKMVLAIVIVFTLSWLPFNILMVSIVIWRDTLMNHPDILKYLIPFLHLLAMAHSIWNPVIYCFMNSNFRNGFRNAATKMHCCKTLGLLSRNAGSRQSPTAQSYV